MRLGNDDVGAVPRHRSNAYYSVTPPCLVSVPVIKEMGMTTATSKTADKPTQGERLDAIEADIAAIKEALASGDPTHIAGKFTKA